MNLLQKRYILMLLVIIHFAGFIPKAIAQDDQKNKNEKEFNNFQNKITNDFENYKSKNDSIFLKFLETSWKEFKLFKQEIKVRVKPAQQPVVGGIKENIEEPPVRKSIQKNEQSSQPEQEQSSEAGKIEALEITKPVEKPDYTDGFDFFGQKVEMTDNNNLPAVKTINTTEIINYYKSYLLNKQLMSSTNEIFQFAQERSLNDWGYLYLLILASEKYYQQMNNRVLFVWMTLLKGGFDVKLGHDEKSIYLLVNFQDKIFNKLHVNILANRYYVYTFPGQAEPQTEISSYEKAYPGEVNPVSLRIYELPGLSGQTYYRKVIYQRDTFSLSLTLPLIEYLKVYPDCDLPVYFCTPVSEKVIRSMDKIFNPVLIGKTEIEKVAIILNFVQRSMPYKTDEQQFGKENYLFADETLYYPYSDCEDRSILLSKLIELYTGLKTIGLDYPDHISLGVRFTKPIQGDFVYFKGEKYYICDPTYIGARIGMAMDFMKDQNPQIIQTSQKN